ncbi:adenylate/guanylate cyclase domain-containing protein [Gordonia sp. TBRC 11910]|uniref:Adenylate/guanylate cyclase domain-containing protein n=1 Tax=Gordonia asplenii TaxID=2725283 RepID=A0A848KZB1_9ACTN|nr:adenylate/guanylate cyclase domain-containing protein [Gordonia asplenii]NMO01521.1 adenylate/guanylate cyclase domain-containing protein [Gordonia asplenii]
MAQLSDAAAAVVDAGARATKMMVFRGVPDFDQREWSSLTLAQRTRMARHATWFAGAATVGGNALIGIETAVMVLFSLNGGRLSFGDERLPSPWIVAATLAGGVILNAVFGMALFRPQLNWFIAGEPADRARRRAVVAIPQHQVYATFLAWGLALLIYLLWNRHPATVEFAAVAGAFSLAAVSSACITYASIERATRPLVVIALRDSPIEYVVHSVRKRMVVVWAVSSAVPMCGLLMINVGRGVGLLPPVAGRIDWATLVLALVSLGAGIRVIALVGSAIADPTIDLSKAVERVRGGDLSTRVGVYDMSELGVVQHGFNTMVEGLEERARVRELFARHVGDTVAAQALEGGGAARGMKTVVGVLFVDITGSTRLATQHDPVAIAAVLNRFFTIVADVVGDHGGFINKFEGDAALAIFGAPLALDSPADAALGAARDLAAQLTQSLAISWGIGVSYGTVFAGNIGAETRYEYTVIGDPVNESARLSDAAKREGVPVLASGAAVAASGEERSGWSLLSSRVLRGRTEPTELFVPDDVKQSARPPAARGGVIADLMRAPYQAIVRRSVH